MRALDSRIWIIHFFIFMLSLNLFLLGIDRNTYKISDENRYVPAALDLVDYGVRWNWTLPPLGEMLIATGIATWGNNALGWRFMSVLFGALSLNAMFALGLILFGSEWAALEVAILCLLNQVLFVQSRVATMDIFMFTFMAWAFVFFFQFQKVPSRRNFILSGIFWGLAIACKWFAIVPAMFCFAYYLFNSQKTWKEKLREASICLLGVPLLIYFLVFLPVMNARLPEYAGPVSGNSGIFDFISLQFSMLKSQMEFGIPNHPFASAWYTWPIWIKQFWYEGKFIDIDGQKYLFGIVLFGNPFVLWVGFASILFTIFEWLKKKNELAKLIALTFLTLFLSWAIIPRKTTFFYYYFPAAMILSLSLVFVFEHLKLRRWMRITFLVLCALSFMFFYPALSFLKVPLDSPLYFLLTL